MKKMIYQAIRQTKGDDDFIMPATFNLEKATANAARDWDHLTAREREGVELWITGYSMDVAEDDGRTPEQLLEALADANDANPGCLPDPEYAEEWLPAWDAIALNDLAANLALDGWTPDRVTVDSLARFNRSGLAPLSADDAAYVRERVAWEVES